MSNGEIPTAAHLNALCSQVDDIVTSVTTWAEASDRAPTEALAAALYDAERALRSARRALERSERTVR